MNAGEVIGFTCLVMIYAIIGVAVLAVLAKGLTEKGYALINRDWVAFLVWLLWPVLLVLIFCGIFADGITGLYHLPGRILRDVYRNGL